MSIREDIERPLTAYEELKAWCEKHLGIMDYKVVPESPSYYATIYFINDGVTYFSFDSDGTVLGASALDDDDELAEHIEDYERNAQ